MGLRLVPPDPPFSPASPGTPAIDLLARCARWLGGLGLTAFLRRAVAKRTSAHPCQGTSQVYRGHRCARPRASCDVPYLLCRKMAVSEKHEITCTYRTPRQSVKKLYIYTSSRCARIPGPPRAYEWRSRVELETCMQPNVR